MTGGDLVRRTGRALWLTSGETAAAEQTLGDDHALTRALARRHTIAIQLLAASIPFALGVAGVLLHHEEAKAVLAASSVVILGLLAAIAVVRQLLRDCVQALIAEGSEGAFIPIVRRERRRLASSKVREQLARTLERALRDVQQTYGTVPHTRPLPGTERLADLAPEVAAVAAALRTAHPRVRGVALTARLLCDGHASPLYAGDIERLREELCRISYLLASSTPRTIENDASRLAA